MKTFNYSSFRNILIERIDKIQCHYGTFTLEESVDKEKDEGSVSIFYQKRLYAKFNFFHSHIYKNGNISLSSCFTLRAITCPEWYDKYKSHNGDNYYSIDEFLKVHPRNNAESPTLFDAMDQCLPVPKEGEMFIISECVKRHIKQNHSISFDTFEKKYIVEMDLDSFFDVKRENLGETIQLYKYTSLETYRNMLNNGMFRMNSIVSMNDLSESAWTDYLLNDDYFNSDDFYKSIVHNRNTLVCSFTAKGDDADMWRLYGCGGSGVCLEFLVPTKEVTKVLYISENNEQMKLLRQVRCELAEKNIQVDFQGLKQMKYFIKSSSYSIEGEYRYIFTCGEEHLNIAQYGNLLSPYKEFKYDKDSKKFGELPFKLRSVTLGSKIAENKTDMPLLVAETDVRFPEIGICLSKKCEIMR